MVAIIMVAFFALVGFIFWLGLWGEKKKEEKAATSEAAVTAEGDD
jgi:hypothetical protein